MPDSSTLSASSQTSAQADNDTVQRTCAACRSGGGLCPECEMEQHGSPEETEEATVQTKAISGNRSAVAPLTTCGRGALAPDSVESVLHSPGKPLDAATRGFMEPRFGNDFSRVRIHTDARADHSARSIGAQAYTARDHIVFRAGQFAPQAPSGKSLLAHELTHVVQQRNTTAASTQEPSEPNQTGSQADEPAPSLRPGRAEDASHAPGSMPITRGANRIQRRTLGMAGACWFDNCESQLANFQMIPEDGPPGFHPRGANESFRVDDIDGFWFKFHSPKNEWFKIPDLGTAHVSCTDDERAPNIGPAAVLPFATAGWTDDGIHTENPYT